MKQQIVISCFIFHIKDIVRLITHLAVYFFRFVMNIHCCHPPSPVLGSPATALTYLTLAVDENNNKLGLSRATLELGWGCVGVGIGLGLG